MSVWATRTRHACTVCGEPTGWVLTDRRAPDRPLCRGCKSAEQRASRPCGTVNAYRKGCRCEACRAAASAAAREWRAKYRAEHGHSYRQNFAGGESTYITRAERRAIYERDGWVCQLCMGEVDPDLAPTHRMAATLDHIEPRSATLVPDHSPSNLRLAHRACNSKRGNRVVA